MNQQCHRKRRRNNENEEKNNDNGHDPKVKKASGGDNEIMKMSRRKRFRFFIHQVLQQGNDDNAKDPKGLKASGREEKESGGAIKTCSPGEYRSQILQDRKKDAGHLE